MTSLEQKNDLDDDDKMDLENSDHLIPQNNDSNKNSTGQYKNPSNSRKTSKRRQEQQEKAVVLQLFKDLIKVVNEKFQNAYLSPPKNNKVPSKAPKMAKNASVKPSKKEENQKKKQQGVSAAINNHKVEEKSQSRELSQLAFPSFAQVNHTAPVSNNVSSPQPFQSFSPSPHVVHSVRKSSQHASHRQKSQNEKPNVVNVLKEALKKEILENYSMEMKYIIHEEIEQQVQEVKPIDSGKMVEQSSENPTKRVHKNSKNFLSSQNLDDLQVLSNQEQCVGKFLESMKHIAQGQKDLINEQSQKCQQEQEEDSESSSSCEQNQKYPPHSHMPEGHASTTQQFLQQHHPIITNLPHSTQVILSEHKQHKGQSNLNVQSQNKKSQEQS